MRFIETMIGMTGHRDLHDHVTSRWVAEKVNLQLDRFGATAGICCLAIGADQIFAEEVLRRGLALTAVVPSRQYEESFQKPDEQGYYRSLLTRSSRTITLSFGSNTDEAFFAGGREVVDAAALLLAVWDGQPSRGLGGTADVVDYARQLGRRIVHINPFERTVTNSA